MIDGSGLSRANRSTASALAHLLAARGADHKLGPAFAGVLSVAGVNGTLQWPAGAGACAPRPARSTASPRCRAT